MEKSTESQDDISQNKTYDAAPEMSILPSPMKVLTEVSCSNPDCSNMITITLKQKREFFTEYFLKYGKIVAPYCSKSCREKHMIELSRSKFYISGNLKNHKNVLIFKGINSVKRIKDKETHIIAGNNTEVRAKLLREKLLLMKRKSEKRCILSTEVSVFLSEELSEGLKVTNRNTRTYSRRVMEKLVNLFPDEFRMGKNDKNLLYVEFVE